MSFPSVYTSSIPRDLCANQCFHIYTYLYMYFHRSMYIDIGLCIGLFSYIHLFSCIQVSFVSSFSIPHVLCSNHCFTDLHIYICTFIGLCSYPYRSLYGSLFIHMFLLINRNFLLHILPV